MQPCSQVLLQRRSTDTYMSFRETPWHYKARFGPFPVSSTSQRQHGLGSRHDDAERWSCNVVVECLNLAKCSANSPLLTAPKDEAIINSAIPRPRAQPDSRPVRKRLSPAVHPGQLFLYALLPETTLGQNARAKREEKTKRCAMQDIRRPQTPQFRVSHLLSAKTGLCFRGWLPCLCAHADHWLALQIRDDHREL